MHRTILVTTLVSAFLVVSSAVAVAAPPQMSPAAPGAPEVAPPSPSPETESPPSADSPPDTVPLRRFQRVPHTPSPLLARSSVGTLAPLLGSGLTMLAAPEVAPASPSRDIESEQPADDSSPDDDTWHHFQWAPDSPQHVQIGVNFGLLQPALGGFNIAGEVRYRRLWLEYSHGMNLNLNKLGGYSLTQTEHDQNLQIFVPYTTGFGVGFTVVDQLWLGVEVKGHGYEVNAPGGAVSTYHTYSVGPVLGYKLYIWRGLYANAFLRYWPNVATSLNNNQIALRGANGTVIHSAHDFGSFANVSIGYTFLR